MRRISIYVAGASSEIERAERMMETLEREGFEVTSTWAKNIRKVGHGNPPTASHEQRRAWSITDLEEVGKADLLLFLLPNKGNATFGAWCELGFATSRSKYLVMSGENHNIFVGLATIYPDDQKAFEAILRFEEITASQHWISG